MKRGLGPRGFTDRRFGAGLFSIFLAPCEFRQIALWRMNPLDKTILDKLRIAPFSVEELADLA